MLMSCVRTFLWSSAALVALSFGSAQPSWAQSMTESAYDMLVSQADTTTLDGTVVDIVSNRVRVRPSNGGARRFYDINREAQSATGLEENGPIQLVLVDDEVVAVSGPSGQYQLSDYEYQIAEMIVEEEETIVQEQETAVVEERETVTAPVSTPTTRPQVVERTEPVRALW